MRSHLRSTRVLLVFDSVIGGIERIGHPAGQRAVMDRDTWHQSSDETKEMDA